MTKQLMSAATRRKQEYVAPAVRTLQASVENGYALSHGGNVVPPQPLGWTGGNESFTGGSTFDGTAFN